MLFFPEGNERRLNPMAQRAEPVDAGMAGGAQGDQPAAVMDAFLTMMNREFIGRPTAAAAAAVALQNLVAAPGEAAAGMPILPVAAGAQSATKEACLAAGTEKPGLPTAQRNVARW